MKRKWKDRFIKRGLAWMLCILLVMQLVGADSLVAMADKAIEILTAEAQDSTGEGTTTKESTTEKAKAAEETTTEKATVEESAADTTTEKEAASEKITTEKVSATEEIPLKGKSNKICVYSVTAVQREQKN